VRVPAALWNFSRPSSLFLVYSLCAFQRNPTFYTQVWLDPLPPPRTDELLQAPMGTDTSLAALTPLLIARTEGNPFFLEESVRTLVETGIVVGEPGAYRLAQALPTTQVPATVEAVLAARIDRLPPEDKRLLKTAAVIGHEVLLPLVQAIAELPETDVHRGLVRLQAAEFLYETRLFPEHEYAFKHALTREVAYSSLQQERRRTLHARIVEALETLAGDRVTEQVERLAHHTLNPSIGKVSRKSNDLEKRPRQGLWQTVFLWTYRCSSWYVFSPRVFLISAMRADVASIIPS
jgi:predicted ATPase